jgi:hypothetical protein
METPLWTKAAAPSAFVNLPIVLSDDRPSTRSEPAMMPKLDRLRLGPAALVVLILFTVSCRPGGPKPYPVKGILKVNGEPAGGATIAFYANPPFDKTLIPTAVTEADGSFRLSTYKPKDGAPAGEYEVTVTWPESRKGWRVGEDRLQKAYADPKKSGIKCRVEARSDNELAPIELTADIRTANPNIPRRRDKKGR